MVDQALGDRRLAKSTIEIKPGGLEGAIAYFGSRPTPALILIEASESGDNLIEKINILAEVCDSGARVLVLGSVNDVSMYRSLIRQGVSDYLVPPFTAKQIIEAVATICIDPAEPSLGRVVSFMATKGGAGSSTIAHNTAWHLARLFADDVAVLDLDLAFGTLGLAFNIESVQSINEALSHPERLDEVLLDRFMVKRDDHMMLLTAPGSLDTDGEVDVESFVVLDIPYRWSRWTAHVLSRSDEIVLTSTLDLACLRDTKSLYTNLSEKRINDAPIRLVLNHQGAYRKSQLSVKDFESTLGVSPALVLQHDPVLFGTAANNGQMIGDFNKRSRVNDGLKTLALSVSGRELRTNNKKGMGALSFFKKKPRKG